LYNSPPFSLRGKIGDLNPSSPVDSPPPLPHTVYVYSKQSVGSPPFLQAARKGSGHLFPRLPNSHEAPPPPSPVFGRRYVPGSVLFLQLFLNFPPPLSREIPSLISRYVQPPFSGTDELFPPIGNELNSLPYFGSYAFRRSNKGNRTLPPSSKLYI